MVTEFVSGGSLDDKLVNQPFSFTFKDLLGFARDAAAGMMLLEEKGVIHRDLAIRNLLVLNASLLFIYYYYYYSFFVFSLLGFARDAAGMMLLEEKGVFTATLPFAIYWYCIPFSLPFSFRVNRPF